MKSQHNIDFKNSKYIYIYLILGLSSLIGIFSLPYFYKVIPSDYIRSQLILETLKNKDLKSDAILFGNSILMAGINAKQLSEELSTKEIYNLSSTGQQLSESILYYDLVDASTKNIFQFINVEELIDTPIIRNPIVRNLRLYDYKISENTKQILETVDIDYFETSMFKVYIDSRGLFTNYINTGLRSVLRKDLKTDNLKTELYYPNTYTERISEIAYKKNIKRHNPINKLEKLNINLKVLTLLKNSASFLKEKNINYHVVISPINPDLINYTSSFKKSINIAFSMVNIPNLNVIDLSETLSSDLFIDHCHPTPEGAVLLTSTLATKFSKSNNNK